MLSSKSEITDTVFPTTVKGARRAISGFAREVEDVVLRVVVVVNGMAASEDGAVLV